jgi:hypothetical protein
MGLRDIDPDDPRLSAREREAFFSALQTFERYVHHGRADDAHGAGSVILIFWLALVGDDFALTEHTGWDDLSPSIGPKD